MQVHVMFSLSETSKLSQNVPEKGGIRLESSSLMLARSRACMIPRVSQYACNCL